MTETNQIQLTDSEQNLYDSLTVAEQEFFKVLRLARKMERREILEALQSMNTTVKHIEANQTKQASWTLSVTRLVKRLSAFINSEIHKLYTEDDKKP